MASFEERTKDFTFTQQDENEIAQMVILNEPALANWMGSIHPNGSLYELPLNVKAAQEEHLNFRRELERNGCFVMTVREILMKDVDNDVVARVKLEELAFEAIKYVLVPDESGEQTLTERDRFLLSDEYKRQAIDKMNAEQLVEIVLTNPTIYLQKADKDTELLATSYSFQPLVNLVFCRDQQITTRNGLVIASLSSPIRERETKVMRFCFTKLGVPIIGQVPNPGKLEGGDFFPLGKDLCMVGVGLRSNMFAIRHLMENDLFGTTRVAVVKDYFDQDQQRMHLDTVFNILKPRCALILETIMGETSPLRRLVDEYTRGSDGKYRLTRHDVEFTKYLADEHTALIPVSEQNQIDYGCNGVNLGNGNLIMVDKATAKVLARSQYFDGKITVIDFRNMTDMYGSVHCCSQVISRKRGSEFAGPDAPARLCKAAASGEIEVVKRLVVAGVDVNSGDYDKRTALHLSASENRLSVVLYLIGEGATVNAIDRWENTPLDDALRHDFKEVIEALRKVGGLTGLEAREKREAAAKAALEAAKKEGEKEAPKEQVTEFREAFREKRSNSSRRSLLVVPSNFDSNPQTVASNVFMKNSAAAAEKLTQKSGRREMRKTLLNSMEAVHKILTVDFRSEVYLFNHEAYENCPDAVFVNDWFTTHSAEEMGEPTLVLYPMMAPNRRTERRPWILDFLLDNYPRVINLTSCEQGVMEVTHSVDIHKVDMTVHPDGKYLEAGAVVLNRKSMTGYCALSERAHREPALLWEKATGYEMVLFDTNDFDGHKLHHTTHVIFIGSGYAIVAADLIAEGDRKRVLEKLEADGLKLVLLHLDQVFNFVSHAAEIPLPDGKLGLLLSSTAYNSLTKEQIKLLKEYVADIKHTDLHTLEVIGGGSVGAIINQLF